MAEGFLRQDAGKTREQLLQEVVMLRQQLARLEASQVQLYQTATDSHTGTEQQHTSPDLASDDRSSRLSASQSCTLDNSQYRQRLDCVLHAARIGVWLCDLPSRSLTWNETCKQQFGLPLTAAITLGQFYELLHPSDRAGVQRAIERTIASGAPYDVVYRVLLPTSKKHWLRAIGTVSYDETGQPVRFDGISIDITAQKQQEEERDSLLHREQVARQLAELNIARVAQLQELAAALAQTLTTAEVVEVLLHKGLDVFGARRGWVAQRHAQMMNVVGMSGYSPEEIAPYQHTTMSTSLPIVDAVQTGKAVLVRSPQEYRERYPALADRYIDSGTQALAVIPLVLDDRVIGAIGLSFTQPQEFTESDRAMMLALAQQCAQALERAQLYQAERTARETAEAANRVKDEFLAVLSHELRSPLNPILGWSRLLQVRPFDHKTTRRALQTIERNAKLQTQLIEDLLDVSRILQGNLTLNISAVDLVSTIEAVLDMVRLAADAKSIALYATLDRTLSRVVGDPVRLQQVVWNLLSNAVKFTPEGGQVTVCLERAGSEPQPNDPYIASGILHYARLTVSDTGRGIHSDFLPYVFDYFRQADSTTTREFGGLGLGLAIVRHLVELHGGSIQVVSPGEGQGATFTVLLPLLRNAPAPPLDSVHTSSVILHPAALPLSGIQVLVVDDEADMREFAAFILKQFGAEVTIARSATEALQLLDSTQPDILLSDIGMPDMDGYALMHQIRRRPPEQGGQIPAIALTSYTGEYNQQWTLAAGFQLHLAKPLEPEALVVAIASLVRRDSAV